MRSSVCAHIRRLFQSSVELTGDVMQMKHGIITASFYVNPEAHSKIQSPISFQRIMRMCPCLIRIYMTCNQSFFPLFSTTFNTNHEIHHHSDREQEHTTFILECLDLTLAPIPNSSFPLKQNVGNSYDGSSEWVLSPRRPGWSSQFPALAQPIPSCCEHLGWELFLFP